MDSIKTIISDNKVIKIVEENVSYLIYRYYPFLCGKRNVKIPNAIKARGIAKCNPTDEFSKEKGEEIAYKRANIKIEKQKLKLLERIEKNMEGYFNSFRKDYTRSTSSLIKNKNRLEELLND